MKIMLIFPPITMKERYSKSIGDVGGNMAPLGLAYMASIILKEGHDVRIIDAPTMKMDSEAVMKEIDDYRPEIIGMTALTSMIHRVGELSRKIKEKYPDCVVLIGGPHATILPNDTAKRTKADIVIMGEGELTIVDILKDIGKSRKRKIVVGRRVDDLDSIPYPAWNLLPMRKYRSLPNNYKRSPFVINMVTSRGCPFRCTYCCKDLYGMQYRTRSVDNVIGEIKYLKKTYGTEEVAFWDDLFTMRRDWIMEFCERLIKEKIDIAWSCETRVNYVDAEMLRKMKEAGCWNIFYGIEAGDQELLNNIRKGTTLGMIRKAVKLTKAAGIETRGSFMIALPGETPELARKTIDFAIELDPDYAQFSITTPFPGTSLYDNASKWGKLSKDFNEYNEWNPVFVPFGYKNAAEIRKIHREAFRRFYFRPSYIFKRILKMRSPMDLKRNILGMRMILGFK